MVHQGSRANVIGILYVKDLLEAKFNGQSTHATIEALLRKVHFVSAAMPLSKVFRFFKDNSIHIAVVTNSNHHPTGIITMSDILDELFSDYYSWEKKK